MRFLNIPQVIGGLIVSFIMAWLLPVAGMPYIIQVAAVFGLGVFLLLVTEIFLLLVRGVKE